MPAFGFLLILVGIFVLINTLNGNLVNLALGKVALNFGPSTTSSPSTTNNTTPTTTAGLGQSGFSSSASAGQGVGGGGGGSW